MIDNPFGVECRRAREQEPCLDRPVIVAGSMQWVSVDVMCRD